MLRKIWYHLHNLKNVINTYGRVLKATLLYWNFSRFLNCTNGTKSRKVSQMDFHSNIFSRYLKTDLIKIVTSNNSNLSVVFLWLLHLIHISKGYVSILSFSYKMEQMKLVISPNPHQLVTFTDEIRNGKLHFLCSVWN